MRQSRLYRSIILIPISSIITILVFLSACEQKERVEEQVATDQFDQFETVMVDSSKLIETAQVDYGAIMEQLFQLEDSIKRNPMDVGLRTALVATAYDSARAKIYTVGYGIADTSACSETRAMQSAERAALIDAQRWAMFIMLWRENSEEPAITETVSGDVSRGTPIQKAILPENKVYLLVEFDF